MLEDQIEDPFCSVIRERDTDAEGGNINGTHLVSEDPFCSAGCDTDAEESKQFEIPNSETDTPF